MIEYEFDIFLIKFVVPVEKIKVPSAWPEIASRHLVQLNRTRNVLQHCNDRKIGKNSSIQKQICIYFNSNTIAV